MINNNNKKDIFENCEIFFFSVSYAAVAAGAGPSSFRAENDSILPTDTFTETDVQEIVQNGFTRDKAIGELRKANGNKTQALASLFAKSLKFQ